jgi:hypothetical protein
VVVELGEGVVAEFGFALGGEEDVAGFEVAVEDG